LYELALRQFWVGPPQEGAKIASPIGNEVVVS
jgi:hypothetical protein